MTATAPELIIGNALMVLADRVIDNGWLAAAGGVIVELGEGRPPRGALDFGGDVLAPGLVELHTDHLETHVEPRLAVTWNAASAVLAYDAQMTAAGVTTVFDCLRVGGDEGTAATVERSSTLMQALAAAAREGSLRADHHTHLRCEICCDGVVEGTEQLLKAGGVGLLSLMDHTPGQRQDRDMARLRYYYRQRRGMSDEAIAAMVAERLALQARNAAPHRTGLVRLAKAHGAAIASHDDATLEHVSEAVRDGVTVAEFPTTLEAAAASHQAGLAVLMGAPNVVRGGSHAGNVAAVDLARAGTLDILSSDYIPASLLLAVHLLSHPTGSAAMTLPQALALVTSNPARALGLTDRGSLTPGLRADLLRLRLGGAVPVVRSVWRQGARVM